MSELENPLRAEKRRKLQDLRSAGVDPYPHNFERTHSVQALREQFDSIGAGEPENKVIVKTAGRLMAKRLMGKAAFFNIQDQSGALQIYVRISDLPPEDQKSFEFMDLGDIVGVEGFMFRTKTGELSLHTSRFVMLCKSLEPLPEKFHGIADIEIKYRHRHLDLIMDPASRKVFETRSKIIREIRSFLDGRGFLEVETPILQPLYGGAAAAPFETHHNALDMKLYLKISPELYLKRLIVGGFEKVYDLNKNFRNEGIDRSHNPEFSMIEWYEAYTDYNYQMNQFEELVAHICQNVLGTLKVSYQGKEIDFSPPWRRLSVYDGIREYGGVDPVKASKDDLIAELKKRGVEDKDFVHQSHGKLVMALFDACVEPHLWQPTFVIDHPVEISPLTKTHRTTKGLVERFEPFAACMEIGNAYTELNDPIDQRARLKEQEASRAHDAEAHPMDEDFLHAIEVGMPPTGGSALGVERMVMILTDRHSIRDIILFPTMKIKK